jgi:hypothetical protein
MSDTRKLPALQKQFYAGFACAVADIIRLHDEPTIAIDVMTSNGVDLAMLKTARVAEYDLGPIKKAWSESSAGRAATTRSSLRQTKTGDEA